MSSTNPLLEYVQESMNNESSMEEYLKGCHYWKIKVQPDMVLQLFEWMEAALPGLCMLRFTKANNTNEHQPKEHIIAYQLKSMCLEWWRRRKPLSQRLGQAWISYFEANSNREDRNGKIDARVKIADLGNSCWINKHFSQDIQTRQYRSPEVLLGQQYCTSADIWSAGCCIFELLTGDLLFDPSAGKNYDRNEDHLAQMIELLGPIPPKFATRGTYSKQYFTKKAELRHIYKLRFWPLDKVLHDKYKFDQKEANAIANFLNPMLSFVPGIHTNFKYLSYI